MPIAISLWVLLPCHLDGFSFDFWAVLKLIGLHWLRVALLLVILGSGIIQAAGRSFGRWLSLLGPEFALVPPDELS